MIELSPEVRRWFSACGWTASHRAVVPEFIPNDHPAYLVLRTFGGITLLEQDCPFDDGEPIHKFTFTPLRTDANRIRKWSRRLRSQLVGIADEHNRHAELYMDEKGRCFSDSLMHDCFAFAGESLSDTLLGALMNRRYRALLAPFQRQVSIYGECVQRGDARIWDYKQLR